MNASAALARRITWASSKQSYLTARLLADRDLVDDCLRAYAYFRWADDQIDISCQNDDERRSFIERQKGLVDRLYRNERPVDLSLEEEMLADLVRHDRGTQSGLRSFIRNFMAVLEFDAGRSGCLLSTQELAAYTTCLATAVMDGIQYFIGNSQAYPKTPDRNLAVIGAHLTHMLRDMQEDLSSGLVNIPGEALTAHGICIDDIQGDPFRAWVREQVEQARWSLSAGSKYIDTLEVLRCKLAGTWYCARFIRILDAIEGDGYCLRREYPERRALSAWLEMAGLGIAVTLKHFAFRIRRAFLGLSPWWTWDFRIPLPRAYLLDRPHTWPAPSQPIKRAD